MWDKVQSFNFLFFDPISKPYFINQNLMIPSEFAVNGVHSTKDCYCFAGSTTDIAISVDGS